MAAPASAELVTTCIGQGGAVTVPGDLVVPAGQSCQLSGTTVTGDVHVRGHANLSASGTDLQGRVDVGPKGFLEARNSVVAGTVASRGAFGVYLVDSELAADAVQRPAEGGAADSFLYPQASTVAGDLRSRTGEVVLSNGSSVAGAAVARGGSYLDSYDSTVGGKLVVTDTASGSVVCDSEIYGNAAFTGSSGTLQLGAHEPVSLCSGATYWGGSVRVADNQAAIAFSNNIVRGDVSGSGNDPAPVGKSNRVRGQSYGQFRDLPVPRPSAQRTLGAGEAGPVNRAAALRASAARQHDATVAASRAAGPAQL